MCFLGPLTIFHVLHVSYKLLVKAAAAAALGTGQKGRRKRCLLQGNRRTSAHGLLLLLRFFLSCKTATSDVQAAFVHEPCYTAAILYPHGSPHGWSCSSHPSGAARCATLPLAAAPPRGLRLRYWAPYTHYWERRLSISSNALARSSSPGMTSSLSSSAGPCRSRFSCSIFAALVT